tara:strand:- start:459 stop:800 length:342 start_codon:yes stop_codon:yes gene_type:complete
MNISEKYYRHGDSPWQHGGYKTEVTIIDINIHKGKLKYWRRTTGDYIVLPITKFLDCYRLVPEIKIELPPTVRPSAVIKREATGHSIELLWGVIVIVVLITLIVVALKLPACI